MPTGSRQLLWAVVLSVMSLALVDCGEHPRSSTQTSTVQPTTATTAVAAAPPAPAPRTQKWIDLAVGDCLAELPQVDLGEVAVTLVDCAAPHKAEVYFRGPLTVNAAIPDVANAECGAQFRAYTGQSTADGHFAVTYLVDSNQDRTTIAPTAGPAPSTVICLLEDVNGQPLTASARR